MLEYLPRFPGRYALFCDPKIMTDPELQLIVLTLTQNCYFYRMDIYFVGSRVNSQ